MPARRVTTEKTRKRGLARLVSQVRVAPTVSDGLLQARRRPLLFVIQGPLLGSVFSIKSNQVLIGRASDADVILRDESISRGHARLTFGTAGAVVEDLNSQGGTFVNEQPTIGPVRLNDGDQVRFGRGTLVKFSLVDAIEENAIL